MIKITPQKIMERSTLHLTLSYLRKRLVYRMIFMKRMMLWMRALELMKQHLQTPRMCSCQLDNLQSMILLNLLCWIISKDNGKVGAIFSQLTMATLKIIYQLNERHSYIPVLCTHIQFVNGQMCPCLKNICIFKSLFWCNYPASCC